MGVRRQFVIDRKTDRLLRQLAEDRDGSRSRVVRQAVREYAEREAYFDRIESDPGFIKMMEESEKAIREGRVVSQEELEAGLRLRRRLDQNRRKKK